MRGRPRAFGILLGQHDDDLSEEVEMNGRTGRRRRARIQKAAAEQALEDLMRLQAHYDRTKCEADQTLYWHIGNIDMDKVKFLSVNWNPVI
jgi:hypothetical protein